MEASVEQEECHMSREGWAEHLYLQFDNTEWKTIIWLLCKGIIEERKVFLGEMSVYESIQKKNEDIRILWIIQKYILWTVSIYSIEKEMKWPGNYNATLSFILCRLLSQISTKNQLKFMSKKHLGLSKRAMIPLSKNKMSSSRWTNI